MYVPLCVHHHFITINSMKRTAKQWNRQPVHHSVAVCPSIVVGGWRDPMLVLSQIHKDSLRLPEYSCCKAPWQWATEFRWQFNSVISPCSGSVCLHVLIVLITQPWRPFEPPQCLSTYNCQNLRSQVQEWWWTIDERNIRIVARISEKMLNFELWVAMKKTKTFEDDQLCKF